MRLALAAAASLLLAAPAFAQTIVCVANLESDAGEVILAYDLEASTGKLGPATVTWLPKRLENGGRESPHFAVPLLAIDYRLKDGKLGPPVRTMIQTTRYSGRGVGAAPQMSDVRVEITVRGREPINYPAIRPENGEQKLKDMLIAHAPARLAAELLAPDKSVIASADFDLSLTAERDTSLVIVKKEADRLAAKVKSLAESGSPPKRCPLN